MKTKTNKTITDLLKQAYAAELETVENYLANSVWLDGLGAQEVAESLAEDVTEELGHATKLAHRLKQLGVCPPGSLQLARNQKALQPPKDSTNVRSVVEGVLDDLAGPLTNKVKFVKINVDEASALAQRMEIQAMPTLVFFKNGKVVDRSVGLPSRDMLKTRLEPLAKVL